MLRVHRGNRGLTFSMGVASEHRDYIKFMVFLSFIRSSNRISEASIRRRRISGELWRGSAFGEFEVLLYGILTRGRSGW